MTPEKRWHECEHEWDEKRDSMYSTERFTDVQCHKCLCPGERDESTGEVFWPAT